MEAFRTHYKFAKTGCPEFGLFLDSEPSLSALVCGLAEVATHALAMPNPGYLPPLPSHMDAVAVGVGSALGAVGKADDASAALADTYRFLGGRFISDARHPIELSVSEPPEGRLERWRWFCERAQKRQRKPLILFGDRSSTRFSDRENIRAV